MTDVDFVVPVSNVLSAIIGAIFAMIAFRGGRRSDTAREQLDKVYTKAFQVIEPVMYQNIPRQDCNKLVQELCEIAENGGVLTDPQFIATLDYYKSAPRGDKGDYPDYKYCFWNNTNCYLTHWYNICAHIDRSYDVLCRKAFLPIRKNSYRLERNQYINRTFWALNLLYFEAPFFIVLLAMLALTLLQILS